MTTASFKRFAFYPEAITAGICGFILVLSVLMPWLSPKAGIVSAFGSATGLSISALVAIGGILGGLLAIGVAFVPSKGLACASHIIIGVAATGILGLIIFNGSLPLRSTVVRNYVSVGFGVYLYCLAAIGLIILGIIERPKANIKTWNRTLPGGMPYRGAQVMIGNAWQPAQPQVMRNCNNCGQIVNPGADFCGNCGRAVASPTQTGAYCASCGHALYPGALYCPACGGAAASIANYRPEPGAYYVSQTPYYAGTPNGPPISARVSFAWWLLPILLGILGGIIAFFAVFKRKPGLAVVMLILGLAITAIEFILIRNAYLSFLNSLSCGFRPG